MSRYSLLPHKRRFNKQRYPLERLVSRMAELRCLLPGGGGNWSGHTGNGQAWHKESGRVWFRTREIKAGQWAGPWVYSKNT